MKLSVVLATRNEEENIGRCLEAVENIADEIIIFDEYSTDETRDIAKKHGAKVFKEKHHDNFHITKQKAIDKAKGEWILQLDADEVVSKSLAKEIVEVINMSDEEILKRRPSDKKKARLFAKHSRIIKKRDKKVGTESGDVSAFFIPRKNMFLGKAITHAGVYPDPAIRLIKKGKAYLPGKSVHEIMAVSGQVLWLFNDLLHYDSPTLSRYISRLNRYTDLHAEDLRVKKVRKNLFSLLNYSFLKPIFAFVKLFFINTGFKDGLRGFVWSLFSAFHYPIAYFKFYSSKL